MPKKLFSFTDRGKAHAKLEEVLAAGKYPCAECREYHNDDEPYQVWDEPVRPPNWQDLRIQDPFPPKEPEISDALLDRLAERLLEKMSEKK